MLEIALIGTTLIATALLVTASGAASFFYGQLVLTRRMLVEGKRRERRQARDLHILHSKFTERAGFGTLVNKTVPVPNQQAPKRRVVPPSQTITELKTQDSGAPKTAPTSVPAGIGNKFLDFNGNGSTQGDNNHG